MDQDVFFSATEQEIDTVNLDVAPTSADIYLKQVMRSRKLCPSVVRVDLPAHFSSTSSVLNKNDQPINDSLPKADSSTSSATTAAEKPGEILNAPPPRWWIDRQCADFSELRRKFRQRRDNFHSKSENLSKNVAATVDFDAQSNLPDLNDEQSWREFLFVQCKVDLAKSNCDDLNAKRDFDTFKPKCAKYDSDLARKISHFYGPNGTPPLFAVLASMPHPYVIDALEFCCTWFCEDHDDGSDLQEDQNYIIGQTTLSLNQKVKGCGDEENDDNEKSDQEENNQLEKIDTIEKQLVKEVVPVLHTTKELTQWLFALMCAVEKPLDPDVCSSLRKLATCCLKKKQKPANKDEEDLKPIFDWFVYIVAYYFGQKDLLA